METFQPFNEFPEDIQRLIFEHAFQGPNSTAVQLALISKKVNGWIEPLIYRTIVTSKIHCNPLRAVDSRKPRGFYKSHVKSLVVDEILENSLIEDILLECHDNLSSLAWWPLAHNRQKWASLLLTQSFPGMRKLSIYYSIFPSDSGNVFSAPIFQNLTHLDIIFPISDPYFTLLNLDPPNTTPPRKRVSWDGLQSLERLTHLHVDMKRVWSSRDPDVTEKLQTTMSDILYHLPPQSRYLSICVPVTVLIRATQLPDHQRQAYDDLIWGRTDPRVVVCYIPEKRRDPRTRQFISGILIKEGFSEYLLPHILNDKLANDFWAKTEELVLRRNQEFHGWK